MEAFAALAAWFLLDRAAGPAFARLVLPNPHGGEAVFYARIGAVRFAETWVFFLYWRARGWKLGDLGLLGSSAASGWRIGVQWGLACALLVALMEAAFRVTVGGSFLGIVAGSPSRGGKLVTLVLAGGFFGPVFEELLFRGALYGGMRQRFGPVPATVVAALVFASAHNTFVRVHPVQLVGGVLFCAAYEASGSLWAPLVLHVSGNLAMFLAPLVLT